ncbi:unnamed protein product [Tetraodon nigroviridis]|uniref:(spotted green pufferfish) hypothetical protein n=1 Tax=Tetraodon nigroviridis TaxID=99883 RepID=Q4RI40_TETNG|nr:unnamed protein product [Tetraodon nigroviridis]
MAIWTEETEDQLISLIQERPALYDISEKHYSNRAVKADLWREIEARLQLSEKELRKRWDSLRTQFARYKKLAPLQKTGRQQWILSQLQFLDPHTKAKESASSLTVLNHSQSAESDSASDEHNSETWTGFPQEDSTKAEQCPISPAPESSTCASTQTHVPAEAAPGAPKQPSALKRGLKRGREAPEESAAESTKLMRSIGKTLEKLTPREGQGDVISTYCRYFEQRMRILPLHALPHFLHEVENCLFKYSVEQSLPLQNSTSKFANIEC